MRSHEGGAGARRRRPGYVLAALPAALVAVALGIYLGRTAPPRVHLANGTGRPAVAFSLPELFHPDRSLSLEDFRGRPLVVNFWASWCFPCQSEVPAIEEVARSEQGTVGFLGVDTNDTRRSARSFLSHHTVTYPLVFMPGPVARIVSAYQLQDIPITVFISADGRMEGSYAGKLDTATLRAAIHQAFHRQV